MSDQDIAEICQLKYRYFRHLDLKEMDQLGEQLTDDCEARYDGDSRFLGRTPSSNSSLRHLVVRASSQSTTATTLRLWLKTVRMQQDCGIWKIGC